MAAATIPHVQVPCPVCGHPFDWPPASRCATCDADLQGPFATSLWQLAREEADLHARQAELRRQLAATAAPIGLPASTSERGPAPRHRRLSDLGAQTLLGLAGAALLAVAAVVFAAVTWRALPTVSRAAILVGAAGGAAGLALWLEQRGLKVTAGAVALLADALVGTVVWAAHTYGATGALVDTGGGALAALGAVLAALALGRRGIRWQPLGAATTWVAAVVLAALATGDVASTAGIPVVVLAATVVAAGPALRLADGSGPRGVLLIAGAVGLLQSGIAAAVVLGVSDGAEVVWPVLAGVGAAALWLAFGGRVLGTAAATAGLAGLGIAALVTLELPPATVMAGIAGVAMVAVGAATVVRSRRVPILVGSSPALVPAVVWTAITVAEGMAGWIQHVGAPWAATTPETPQADPGLAVMALATTGAVVLAVSTQWPHHERTAIALALPVAASTAAWHLGVDVWLLAAVAGWAALGGLLRFDGTRGRQSMAAWTTVAVGWSLPSPMLSTVTAGVAAIAALAARLAPVGRHVEQSVLAVVLTAVAATGAVVWAVGATQAAAVAGPVAAGVAVLVATIGHRTGLHAVVTASAVGAVGVVATATSAVVGGPAAGARTSAVLAAGALALAVVWRGDRPASLLHAATAILSASATSAFLLHDAGVTTPEAYTAVPAALALAAGVAWMRRDRTVRSWAALQPGLALAIGPTLVLLAVDPQDTALALAAAILAAVALLAGATQRVVAPLAHGAVATATVVVTQLVVVAGHLPRWLVYATLGALLVAASATFEHQRIRARTLRERVGSLAATCR